MEELEVTWLRAATVWWAFIWRSLLIGFGIGFVAAVVATITGYDAQGLWVSGLIYCTLIPIGIWLFKYILTKQFNGFRIALVPISETSKFRGHHT